jgi:hypothetical protein
MTTYALITGSPFEGGLRVRKLFTAATDDEAADAAVAAADALTDAEWWVVPVEDEDAA